MKNQKKLHIRSQRSIGSRYGKFGGPDCYVAVTIAPDDVKVPYTLNRSVLAKRGIEIKFFGEGYRRHSGPKSKLGQAIAAAEVFCMS